MILLGSCILSANSFAATNTEIVENLYESGTAPAIATDFSERIFGGDYITPLVSQCVVLDGTDQPSNFDISRTIRVTPAHGPLVPEKQQEKLVFGDNHLSYNLFQDPVALAYNMTIEPVVQGLDLTVTNPIYKMWVDGSNGSNHFVPAQLFARKSGQYIAFKVIINYGGVNVHNEIFYGYCYSAGSLPLF